MTRTPELIDYTSKYGPDEGWRRWAVAVSKLGYNPSIPSIDWIREASGMPSANPRLTGFMWNFAYPPPSAPPGTTTPPGTTIPPRTTPGDDNGKDPAKDLSNAKEPPVPNFIQPYQNVTRGFGAYGERDIF